MIEMNKPVLASFTILCLLSIVFLIGFHISVKGSPELHVHNLDTGLDYATIQEAIDAPETLNGHTIFVDSGIYHEHVIIDKSLIILGNNSDTTIDGNGTGTVVSFATDEIYISHCTIQNGECGIELGALTPHRSSDSTIEKMTVRNCDCGIDGNIGLFTIKENIITNCNRGMYLLYCVDFILTANIVANNTYGLELWGGSGVLRNNTIEGNTYNFGTTSHLLDVDVTNTVDSKPIHYLVNMHNITINPSTYPEIGYLALVNCANITVENLSLSNNIEGVKLINSDFSTFRNLNVVNNSVGLRLIWSSGGNVISKNTIMSNGAGISFDEGSSADIVGNNITKNGLAIGVQISSATILENNIFDNEAGIGLGSSLSSATIIRNILDNNSQYNIHIGRDCYGRIIGNNISHSEIGVEVGRFPVSIMGNNIFDNQNGLVEPWGLGGLYQAKTVYHNNFVNNTEQATSGTYILDNGYEGNYWSNYNGTDDDNNGIGDMPYVIDGNCKDDYPLMGPFTNFTVTSEEETYPVSTISNSTVSHFQFDCKEKTISFNASGEDETIGFCRIMIPKGLMEPYGVIIDRKTIDSIELPISNSTHAFLYFSYVHSTHEVIVIPKQLYFYYDLLDRNTKFLETIAILNSTYQQLLDNVTNLQGKYDSLLTKIDDIQGEITLLNLTLTSGQEGIINELGYMADLMYVFAATTIILIAAIVYFAIIKPRIKP